MLRKAVWSAVASVVVTLVSLSLLVMGVAAQSGTLPTGAAQSDEAAFSVQPNVAAARVTQIVPVTLTLTIPGPTGPITVEVPIFLNLDIQIGISPELTTTLTTTVAITPSVATDGVTDVAATPTATVESTPESTVAAPTETPTETPTARSTATPDAVISTATPVPAEPPPPPSEAILEPTAAPAPVVEAPLCPDPRAVIVAPGVGQVVSGNVNMLGTATHEEFQYYKVEYAPGVDVDPNESFVYLADARTQVTGGVLATFDSTILDNGDYTLKLTVVDRVGNFPPPCTVSVVVAN